MDQHALAAQDSARKDALATCEIQIVEGKRRGLEAIRSIGEALKKIDREEYWRDEGYASFLAYAGEKFGWDRAAVWRIFAASETIATLEDAGATNIPVFESQLVLLHKIPAKELPRAWKAGLAYLDEQGQSVSTGNIKKLVTFALGTKEAPLVPKVNPKINIDSEEDGDGRKHWTEEGELALERIGRLVGDDVRESIEQGILEMNERDLIRWAGEEDVMLKNLAHYIVNERWSLGKAVAYEQAALTEDTTLSALARFATARGGEYQTEIHLNNIAWEIYIRKQAQR